MRVKLQVEGERFGGWLAPRHPDDVFRTWDARPAPFLEVILPWAGQWAPWLWRLRYIGPSAEWPCWQVVVGPVYVRTWRRGLILYWTGYEPALMAVATTIEG